MMSGLAFVAATRRMRVLGVWRAVFSLGLASFFLGLRACNAKDSGEMATDKVAEGAPFFEGCRFKGGAEL